VKKLKSVITFSSIFALVSALGLSPTHAQAPPSKQPTTFACIPQGENFATVAKRANLVTPPIIIWKDKSFGDKYTPQKRCEIVSKRLSDAVAEQKGRLSTLRLTHGVVGGNAVICHVNNPALKCTAKNTLLTLKPEDKGKEAELIKGLVSFSVSGKVIERGSDTRTIADFGNELEKKYFSTTDPVPESISPSQNPVPSSKPSPATP
jgi:Circadian oscillating protein COP23